MKATASLVSALLALTSACASTQRTPSMPTWTAPEDAAVPASAPRDIDDDEIRVPRPVEERQTTWAASGLYIGGAIVTSQPMGDFDGDTALAGTTDFVLVPDLDPGAGLGLFLSYRWHMNEMVVQYSFTEHDGEFSGTGREHDTTFRDFDLMWRHYWWESSFVQPYGVLGLGLSRAEIDNGTTDQATGTVFDDAVLTDGIALDFGIGASISLKWITLFGQGMYRFVRYETSRGLDGTFSNTPDVDGDMLGLQFGAQLRVLPPRK